MESTLLAPPGGEPNDIHCTESPLHNFCMYEGSIQLATKYPNIELASRMKVFIRKLIFLMSNPDFLSVYDEAAK